MAREFDGAGDTVDLHARKGWTFKKPTERGWYFY